MIRTHAIDWRPAGDGSTALLWTAVVGVEAVALLAYFATTSAAVEQVRYLLYPFAWINAGLWAVLNTAPTAGNRRHRLVALGLAGAYLLLVMAVPGKVGTGAPGTPFGVRVGWYAPGWGPLVAVESSLVRLYLVPFEVVGYGSLSYLVYANALSMARGALPGVFGLATCVGCTVPLLAPAVGLLGGPATGLATTAYRFSYDVGTFVFLLTVGLLYASHARGRSRP